MYNNPNLQPGQFAIYAINRVKVNVPVEKTIYNPEDESTKTTITYPTKIKNQYLPITFFDGTISSRFSTYDENLSVKNNAQYSLSFSIAKYNNGEVNPFFYLIVENRRLRLQTYDNKIDFIITGITPNVTQGNTIYNVTCQDVFSYDFTKKNILISYSNKDTGPQNIKELSSSILTKSKLNSKWEIDQNLESNYYADFPSLQMAGKNMVNSQLRMTVSFDVNDTTPYNAIIQVADLFNAFVTVTYPDDDDEKGVIHFTNKDSVHYRGYNLRPEVNVSSMSLTRKTDNFCSVLRVSGGEDADGILTSIVPSIPTDVQDYLLSMYPKECTEADIWDVLRSLGTTHCVLRVIDDENANGKCRHYIKVGEGNYVRVEDVIPWTELTSEDIKKDFIGLVGPDGKTYYKTNTTKEIDDFFNFLINNAPSASSLLYNFDYYYNNGLMTSAIYQDINKMFSIDLRNVNLLIYCINSQYYILKNKLDIFEQQEEEYMAQLAALNEEEFGYINGDLKLESDNSSEQSLLQATANGDLVTASVYAMIDEQRINILNQLVTEVWSKPEYSKLLVTFYGSNAINEKINELSSKFEAKNNSYNEYSRLAENVLANYAKPGTLQIKEVSASMVPSGTASSSQNEKGQITLYFKYEDKYFEIVSKDAVNTTVTSSTLSGDGYQNSCIIDGFNASAGTIDSYTITTYSIDAQSGKTIKTVYTGKAAKTTEDREIYLMNSNQIQYTNYSSYKSKVDSLTSFVDIEYTYSNNREDYDKLPFRVSNWSNKYLNSFSVDAEANTTTITKLGLYSVYIELLRSFGAYSDYLPVGAWKETLLSYKNPLNIVQWKAQTERQLDEVWKTIYSEYGDYIVESYYSDTNQLSSSGLYMSALKAFSQYKQPTYDYNTTIINQNSILNIESSEVKIGDIVYLFNKEYQSQYNGRIIIKVPKSSVIRTDKVAPKGLITNTIELMYDGLGEINCRLSSHNEVTIHTTGWCELHNHYHCGEHGCPPDEVVTLKHNYLNNTPDYPDDDIQIDDPLNLIEYNNCKRLDVDSTEEQDDFLFIYCKCDLVTANEILSHIEQYNLIKTGNKYFQVLGIEMERKATPIPLQVTGLSTKLRERTTQLTVSNDRAIQKLLARMISQSRF